MNVQSDERHIAREQLVTAMLGGQSWQQVSAGAPVPVKRAMAYRLLHAVRTKGNIALQDGRHGHPIKLRGEARTFLEEYCRKTPQTPSSTLQMALRERFDLQMSVSQINRVRAALGVSNLSKQSPQEKKRQNQGLLRHSQSGKKVQGVFCYLLPPMRRNCFLAWRLLSPRTCPRLIHRYVSPIADLHPCAVCCSPCSFCKRWRSCNLAALAAFLSVAGVDLLGAGSRRGRTQAI